MSKIEGIELAELINENEAEILKGKRADVFRRIRIIYDNISTWLKDKEKLEKDLAKITEKIIKAQEGIVKIKNGDWNTLDQLAPLPQQKQEAKKEESAQ